MISTFQVYILIAFAAIGWLSYRRKKVDLSGYASILVVSAALIISQAYPVLVGISLTFLSSALITTFKKRLAIKRTPFTQPDAPRNWKQAAANVGVPVLFAVAACYNYQASFTFAAFAALACASADTWSSEIGVLSRKTPVFLVSRKNVQTGVSGGVTALGSISAIVGSLLIASVYYAYYSRITEAWCILVLGFLGALFDSLIGELFQAKYLTQTNNYSDDMASGKLVKGFEIISNNAVNLIAVSFIAALAFVIKYWLFI
jgi:uncharacterized protein (TIGR00297 family)